MKSIAVVIGLTLALASAAAAQNYTTLPTLPNLQSPRGSSQSQLWRSIQRQNRERENRTWQMIQQNSQRQRKPIDWRNFVDSPAERQRQRGIFEDQHRQSEADHLNYLRNCAKYNRGCFNELGGR